MSIKTIITATTCLFIFTGLHFRDAVAQEGVPTAFEGRVTGIVKTKSHGTEGWDEYRGETELRLFTVMDFISCPDCIILLQDPVRRANVLNLEVQYPIFWGKTARDAESGEPVRMQYNTSTSQYSTKFSSKQQMQLILQSTAEFSTDCYDWALTVDVFPMLPGAIPHLTSQYWLKSRMEGNIRMYIDKSKYYTAGTETGKRRLDEDKIESFSEDLYSTQGIRAGVVSGCDPGDETITAEGRCDVLKVSDPHALEAYLLNPQGVYTLRFEGRSIQEEYNSYSESHYTIEISFWPKGARDTISIEGCELLTVGESVLFPVTCKPSGGQVFYSAGGDGITVSDGGGGAKVTAIGTGNTSVCVKYVTKEGKEAFRCKPVTVVELIDFNKGHPVKVGLYSSEGKLTNPLKSVSFSAEPAYGSTLLQFKPMDEALISLARTANDQLTLQGLQHGKTTLQAYTDCDVAVGPPQSVSVVNCDDDVIRDLQDQSKQLKSRLESNLKQQMEALTSKEFDEADKNGRKVIESLAKGLADLAITAYSPGKPGAKAIQEAYSLANNVSTTAGHLAGEEYGMAIWEAANMAASGSKAGDISGIIKNLHDLASNAAKMGEYLGTLTGVSDQLKQLMEQYDKTQKEYLDVLRILHRVCREGEDSPPGDDATGDGTEPGDGNQKPQPDNPGGEPANHSQKEPVNQPGDSENSPSGQNQDAPYTPSTPRPQSQGGSSGVPGLPLGEESGCNIMKIPEVSGKGQNIKSVSEFKSASEQIAGIYSGFSAMVLQPLTRELEAIEAFWLKLEKGPSSTNDTTYFNELTRLLSEIEGDNKADQLMNDVVEFKEVAGDCPQKLFESITVVFKGW
jgi:hypothetical protein